MNDQAPDRSEIQAAETASEERSLSGGEGQSAGEVDAAKSAGTGGGSGSDRRVSSEMLALLAERAPVSLYLLDLESMRNVWANRSVVSTLGYSEAEIAAMGEDLISRLLHPEDLARYGPHLDRLQDLEDGQVARFEYRMRHRDGSWVWLVSEETPFARDEDDIVTMVAGSAQDVTERRALEEKERAFTAELNHRIKNLFAIVPTVVGQSLRGLSETGDIGQTGAKIRGRLDVIGRSHAMAMDVSSEHKGVLLEALVETVLAATGGDIDRFLVSGPPVRLATRGNTAIALALHELADNAVEHGALTKEAGLVRLAWVIDEGNEDEGKSRSIRLQWSETGGPFIAGEPEHKGFGMRIIERLVSSQGGWVEWSWRAYGMSVTMEMPLFTGGAEPAFPISG